MKKIKIVLLTCFSNEQVRSKLVLNNKSKILNIIRKILGKPAQKINHGDYAPWNSALIEELNKRDDVELHVISPQVGLNKKLENLKIENVKYYIFNTDLTLIFKHIIGFDRLWRMLQPNGRVVNSLIKKIKPDIINLVGAENSHLSVSSLSIRDIPTYVSCQTVYNNPNRIKYSQVNKKNLSTEKLILEKEKYFGCSGLLHRNLVKKINPEAKIFDFSFVNSKFPEIKDCPKKYNFVTFAAQNEKQKGIFDLLSAFILLNKIYPKATLNINGGMREEVKVELDKIIFDNNLSSNITITPFFDKQIDLFRHLKKSEIAVLPIKLDMIPGTVIQAMALEIPVVTNSTTGTPKLNKDKKCVMLAEIENIDSLYRGMRRLYEDPVYAKSLSRNALEYFETNYNNPKAVTDKLVTDFRAVIDHYSNKSEIPSALLFNDENR